MMAWITENMGTVLITLFLIVIVMGSIRTLIKDKKQGRSACGGNCAHCGMHCGSTSQPEKHEVRDLSKH